MGRKREDLVGKTYGKLLVLKYSGITPYKHLQWLCECECGVRKVITGDKLRDGSTKSCGCSSGFDDLTGQTFNMLYVDERVDNTWDGDSRFLCKCSCGGRAIVQGASLKSNSTRSCGCLLRNTKNKVRGIVLDTELDDSVVKSMYSTFIARAKARGLEWVLSKETFKELVVSNCDYCNRKPSNFYRRSNKADGVFYTGIDRIDSDFGYLEDNVVPCCKICNKAKLDYSREEFLDWIKTVYRHNNEESDW